jgi:phosphoribosyl-AMP cyclohydrolase
MDFSTGEVMIFTEDKAFWAKQMGAKMTELGIKYKEEGKIGVYFENKPDKVYDMIAAGDSKMMECRLGDQKLNDYEKRSDNVNPEKLMDAIESSFPKAEDFKIGNPEVDALPAVADAKHLMFWFHKPKQYWKKGKTLGEGTNKRAAAIMKLSNEICIVLHTDLRMGDMVPACYNAQLTSFNASKPTEFVDGFDVQSGFQGEVCKEDDKNYLQNFKLADNGDLIATVKRIDKFDMFDQQANDMAKDDVANGMEARFEIRKEEDYEYIKEIRFNAKTGEQTEKEISKKTL